MIVNKQKEIRFKNDCNCLVDYKELAAAIVWYQGRPSCQNKKIYMYGKYPAVSIHFEKIHVHRLLTMYWEKRVLNTKEYVHHKNENKLDSTRLNLEILPAATHQSISNKGRKQSKDHVLKRTISMSLTRYGKLPSPPNQPV